MKKITTLLALAICLDGRAQCPTTVTVTAVSNTVCAGTPGVLTASTTTTLSSTYVWSANAGSTTTATVSITPIVTTNYTVTATTGTCAAITGTITITVNPKPDTSVTISYLTWTYAANAAPATYQWINCIYDSLITGATNQTISVTPCYAPPCAVIITQNNCTDTSSCHQLICEGIQSFSNNNQQVTIYPNPTSTSINLTISPFDNLKMNSIEIFNTIGECVHRQIATSSNSQIDVSDLAEGIYTISLISNEGVVNKKLVIVR